MKKTLKKLKNYLLIGATSIATIFGAGTLTGCGNKDAANEVSIQKEQEELKNKMAELEANYKELKEENAELRKKLDDESISIQEENGVNQTYETNQSYIIPCTPIREKEAETVIEKKEETFDEIINTVQFDSVKGTCLSDNYNLSFYLENMQVKSIDVASTEEYLNDCTKISRLSSLDLSKIDLTNPDNLEKVILSLKLNSQLEEIKLNWCQINDDIMSALASSLSNNITNLTAMDNYLTNLDFLKYGFSNLRHINLEYNMLTDISELNYLENADNLELAHFGGNFIIDSSPLKRFNHLTEIGLENNKLADPTLLPTQSEILCIYNNNWDEEDIEALETICTPDKISGEYHYYPGFWQEQLSKEQAFTRSLNR